MKKKQKNKHFEFSKLIIMQESVLVWLSTLFLFYLALKSIQTGYAGSLPYLTTLVGAIWAAYGVSVAFYYNKAKAENLNKQHCTRSMIDTGGDTAYEDMSGLKTYKECVNYENY